MNSEAHESSDIQSDVPRGASSQLLEQRWHSVSRMNADDIRQVAEQLEAEIYRLVKNEVKNLEKDIIRTEKMLRMKQ